MGPAGYGEVGQQRDGLAGVEGDGSPVQGDFRGAEEPQSEFAHF